jgi:hypothetical protein
VHVRASSSSEKNESGFSGFFKKKIEEGKKALDVASSKLSDAHKKNIEKLDSIAKQDVEFTKWILLDGQKTDATETHKKNVELLDELSKSDIEFVKSFLDKANPDKPAAFEVIDVVFEEADHKDDAK